MHMTFEQTTAISAHISPLCSQPRCAPENLYGGPRFVYGKTSTAVIGCYLPPANVRIVILNIRAGNSNVCALGQCGKLSCTNSSKAGVKKPMPGTKACVTTFEPAPCAGIDDNNDAATARLITVSMVLPNCFVFSPILTFAIRSSLSGNGAINRPGLFFGPSPGMARIGGETRKSSKKEKLGDHSDGEGSVVVL